MTAKTRNSGGYTILKRDNELFVLCDDGMFRRIIKKLYQSSRRNVVIDQTHSTFFNPVYLYE